MLRYILIFFFVFSYISCSAQYNIKKMMEEGRKALDEGYYVVSMQIFSKVVALRLNDYEAWYLLALSKYHLEDFKGAYDDSAKAITLQPYIAAIYDLYGMSSIKIERYDTAIEAYAKALDIEKNNKTFAYNKAYSLYLNKHIEEAKVLLKDIIQQWSNFDEAKQLLGEIKANKHPLPRMQNRQMGKSSFPIKLNINQYTKGDIDNNHEIIKSAIFK